MDSKLTFITQQLTSFCNYFGIQCMCIKEGYVEGSDAAENGIVYDEQIMYLINGNRLGHSAITFYTNKEHLVAALLKNVTDTFLNTTKTTGLLYGVKYGTVKKAILSHNDYIYIF